MANTPEQPVPTPAIPVPEIIPVEAAFQLLSRPVPDITTVVPWSGWDEQVLSVIRHLMGLAEERGYLRAMFDAVVFDGPVGTHVQSKDIESFAQSIYDDAPEWAMCQFDEPEVPESGPWWLRY